MCMTEIKKTLRWQGWRLDLLMLIGIVTLGAVLYAQTLTVPMYLDDSAQIIYNSDVLNLTSALDYLFTSARGLITLTFALNYYFGGAEVAGYHLVNIVIHLITACLVYLLLKRVFPTRLLLACGGALLFVAHPLQTQAVTYIVQRATCLAGLFFFLALYLYVRAREAEDKEKVSHWVYYVTALICGAVAVLVKQNTAVLPVALILFDRYFLPPGRLSSWRRLLLYVAPFALAPLWSGVSSLLVPFLSPEGIDNVGSVAKLVHLEHLSPLNYLVTEFSVIWLYLRLLFLPYGQALDYDLPIVASLWSWGSAIALFGIVVLLAAAFRWRDKWPVISAGILWFFLGLAVESTIIPLDPVFEHRLYIPMFGFALVVMGMCCYLSRRGAITVIVLITSALSVLTWQRNALWNDPLAFQEENLRQAPRNERVHLTLGNIYLKEGRLADAERSYQQALAINPAYVDVYVSFSKVYTTQYKYREAVDLLKEGLRRTPQDYRLYNNLAFCYTALGDYREAAAVLQQALRLQPESPELHFNLGVAYQRQGLLEQAIPEFRRAISLRFDVPMSYYFNLGMALLSHGAAGEALPVFQVCYRQNPNNPNVLYNLVIVYRELGDLASASRFTEQLQRINPGMARRLTLREKQGNN